MMRLHGTFYLYNKRCHVTLTDNGISWESDRMPNCKSFTQCQDIIILLLLIYSKLNTVNPLVTIVLT